MRFLGSRDGPAAFALGGATWRSLRTGGSFGGSRGPTGLLGRRSFVRLACLIVVGVVFVAGASVSASADIVLPGLGKPFVTTENGGLSADEITAADELWVGVPAGPGGGQVCLLSNAAA